jgi:hypothetical protein
MARTDEARFGRVDWTAVRGDARGFLAQLLDHDHAVVGASDRGDPLVDYCAVCGMGVDPSGAALIHAPDAELVEAVNWWKGRR